MALSAWEYFGKLAFKKKDNANGCISKARANSELELTFSESRLNDLQNGVVFFTLYLRGDKAGRSATYNPGALPTAFWAQRVKVK